MSPTMTLEAAQSRSSVTMTSPVIEEAEEVRKTSAPMILVLGETGAGKSHFINRLAGETVCRESARLHSCTKHPQLVEVRVGEHDFLMVDTPGFNDTWRSDSDILAEICRTLTLQTQLGVKLRGILYLHNLHSKRLTNSHRRHLAMLKKITGEQTYPNVLLLTTHWPSSYAEEVTLGFGIRESELPSTETFWKDMIKGGAKMLRWYDDEEGDGARAIVAGLVGKRDVVLQLQEELRDGRKLRDTSAGGFVVNARQDDEAALAKLKVRASVNATPAEKEELVQEIARLAASVESRKAGEPQLQDEPTSRIRREIRHLIDEAKRRRRNLSAADIFRWLIGISELTVQMVQTVMTS